MALTSGEYLRWYSSSRVSISFGVSAVVPAAVSASLSSDGMIAASSHGVERGRPSLPERHQPGGAGGQKGSRARVVKRSGAGHADARAGPRSWDAGLGDDVGAGAEERLLEDRADRAAVRLSPALHREQVPVRGERVVRVDTLGGGLGRGMLGDQALPAGAAARGGHLLLGAGDAFLDEPGDLLLGRLGEALRLEGSGDLLGDESVDVRLASWRGGGLSDRGSRGRLCRLG